MESFISLKDRLSMPYKEFGKDDSKILIVDLDKAVKAELDKRNAQGMTNIIEIRAIKIDKYKETRKSLTYARDERTGIYYGIPIGTHLDGNVKWRKIVLSEHNYFNLSKPMEAKMWFVARFNPFVAGSPFHQVEPEFEIWDPDMEAKRDLARATALGLAISRAKTMKGKDLLGMARFLGLPIPEEISEKLLRAEIMRFVMLKPVEFNNKFDDENRQIGEIFFSALALGLIVFDIEHGYSYKGNALGANEYDSIRILQKDTLLLTSISSVLKQTDTDAEKLAAKEEGEKEPADVLSKE